MIIDGHIHLFKRQSAAYPRAVSELFPPQRESLAEEFLGLMARHDVARAVVVPLASEDKYLRDCLSQYPGSFVGVAVQDEADPDARGSQERRAKELRVRGLRVSRLGAPGTRRAEDLDLYPALDGMADRGEKLWFYAPPDQLPLLALVPAALPNLTVVLNHLGFCPTGFVVGPDGLPHIESELPAPTLPLVLALAKHPNTFVMVSGQYGYSKQAYPYGDLTSTVRAIFDAYGPDRMFWASDYPWIARAPGYERMIELPSYELPHLSTSDLDSIMRRTVSRIFDLEETLEVSAEGLSKGAP